MSRSLDFVAKKYLSLKGIYVSDLSELKLHPDYPSLLSVSDALHAWGIENYLLELKEPSLAALSEFSLPIITFSQVLGKAIIIIKTTDDAIFYYTSEGKSLKQISAEDFFERWQPIVLVAYPKKETGKIKYIINKLKSNTLQLAIGALLLIIFFLFINQITLDISLTYISLFLIKLLGLAITVMLFKYKTSGDKNLIDKVCKATGDSDCYKVLNSPVSNLYGAFELSGLGMAYFSSGVTSLAILSSFNLSYAISFSFCFSLLPAFFSFFSVWYQKFIIKKWCFLCIGTFLVCWLEVLVASLYIKSDRLIITPVAFLIGLFLFLLFFLSTWLYEKHILFNDSLKDSIKKLNSIKYDVKIFDFLLQSGKQVSLEGVDKITVDDNGKHVLTIVTNPACAPCAKLHNELKSLILNKKLPFKINIIFAAGDDLLQEKYSMAKNALQNIDKFGRNIFWEKPEEVYYQDKQASYDIAAEKYNKILTNQHDWCAKNIKHTPTIFFNDRVLPDCYSISDLYYFST
ncbi:MAG: hypothetical protein DYG98_19900 [Haliscomenobacteraceae bacterium CHB4]|nr:hypothetical protein [Saprospiraceae bacterium]MCE7925323.1 hypothetical protein [Haliscomenobacteraceae bacterium CHB4]